MLDMIVYNNKNKKDLSIHQLVWNRLFSHSKLAVIVCFLLSRQVPNKFFC